MSDIFNSSNGDWCANARINQPHNSNNWTCYAEGYKMAAEAAYKNLLADGHSQDFLVYPIIFLYRHYMELRLKEIIEHGGKLIDKGRANPNSHNLEELWVKDARDIALEIFPEAQDEEIVRQVEAIFHEFSSYDAKSFSFRYPIDTKGNQSLSFNMINIQNFGSSSWLFRRCYMRYCGL